MLSNSLTDVEKTCLGTCTARCSVRSEHPEAFAALLDPSWDSRALGLLLQPSERPAMDAMFTTQRHNIAAWIGCRTCELDSLALSSCCPQVVLLGSGMDMRPWRLQWHHGTTVFELDTESIVSARNAVAREIGAPQACTRVPVPVNLGNWQAVSSALLSAGFDATKPVVWVAEGLLGYLAEHEMAGLLQGARDASCAGSVLVATAPPSPQDRDKAEEHGRKLYHKTFEQSSATAQRMGDCGWANVSVLPGAATAAKYGMASSCAMVQDILVARP